jgi:hypothetical protein
VITIYIPALASPLSQGEQGKDVIRLRGFAIARIAPSRMLFPSAW